jgi:hypothetical protein
MWAALLVALAGLVLARSHSVESKLGNGMLIMGVVAVMLAPGAELSSGHSWRLRRRWALALLLLVVLVLAVRVASPHSPVRVTGDVIAVVGFVAVLIFRMREKRLR